MSIELDRLGRGVAAFALSVSTLLALKKNGALADYELADIVEQSLATCVRSRAAWGAAVDLLEQLASRSRSELGTGGGRDLPNHRDLLVACKGARDSPAREITGGTDHMTATQKGMVRVAESGSGPYSQILTAGRHTLSADEPRELGGHNLGPSPYEYILAGLGACTAMTLRSYITRHNWGVDRIIIELQHEKIAAADRSARVDKFRRFVHLKGSLSEGQR
jgi:putative redox protein